jgi:multiple sugar transport system ATP-binding protein
VAEIVLDRVTKSFRDGTVAVRDLSLEARDGELLVLVGPSGCGKSTILRMVAGLDTPSAGTIKIGGRPVDELTPGARDVAMVFQDYALYPHMTAYKNIAFALKPLRLPRPEVDRRVRSSARVLGIESLLGRRPRALSGGERQRVALGRALVRDPTAFLLDEPLSNLDAKLRVEMRAEIRRLHDELGTTFLYVTHDQIEATTVGGRDPAGGRPPEALPKAEQRVRRGIHRKPRDQSRAGKGRASRRSPMGLGGAVEHPPPAARGRRPQ